jgi:hypothetical protein
MEVVEDMCDALLGRGGLQDYTASHNEASLICR